MAQLDPSIILGVRPPQIRDPLEAYGSALNVQGLQQQNMLREQTMRQAQEDRARSQQQAQARNALLSRYSGEDLERKLIESGFVDEGLKIGKDRRENLNTEAQIGERKAKTLQTEYETKVKKGERNAQLLRAAVDQNTWNIVRNLIGEEAGPDTLKNIPQEFNPQLRDAMLQATITEVQRLADQRAREKNQNDRENDIRTDNRVRSEGALNRAAAADNARSTAAGGRPPPGYRFTPEGNLEAIPGGPADIKAGEAGRKAEMRTATLATGARNVLDAVRSAKDMVGLTTAGPGSLTAGIPMTPARDLRAKLETIKGNLGFDRLQQMRDMSPTGGALGQVAVQELMSLQSTVASLDQAQSPQQLREALEKVETHYNNWLATLEGQAPTQGGGGAGWSIKRLD